jgi:NhaA family Na+:H+ antiporter
MSNRFAALREFLRTEASGGAVLLLATIAALVWANLWSDSYDAFWHHEIGPGAYRLSLESWASDGLMTVFFFVVGLEIKRELVTGELRDRKKAVLPIVAAAGGMVGPALIYLVLADPSARRGWGIPTATDIAFTLGVLSIIGSRVPDGLKAFLLALAIADDVGGIVVIAVFYAKGLSFGWLMLGAVALALVLGLRGLGVNRSLPFLPLGVFAWIAMFHSGVHPTIAGVALGLLTPALPIRGRSVLEDLQRRLHPVSSYAIVPIFALANAGITLDAATVRDAARSTVFWGIVAGLVIGKTVGIGGATWLGVRLRLGLLPDGVRVPHVLGVASLAGIGFTVALFMAGLAFDDADPALAAKVAILTGSIVSALIGTTILLRTRLQAGSKSMSDWPRST